jgi:hypothetical protein
VLSTVKPPLPTVGASSGPADCTEPWDPAAPFPPPTWSVPVEPSAEFPDPSIPIGPLTETGSPAGGAALAAGLLWTPLTCAAPVEPDAVLPPPTCTAPVELEALLSPLPMATGAAALAVMPPVRVETFGFTAAGEDCTAPVDREAVLLPPFWFAPVPLGAVADADPPDPLAPTVGAALTEPI